MATYSSLNNDVSDCSIAKSRPWSWAIGVTDLLEDDTLVEVDSVISNIAVNTICQLVFSKTPDLHVQEKPRC